MMHLPKDYLDDLLVRIAHHSCAIENNTITLSETISVLLYRMITNKVSVREFYEVENHRLAFNYVIENIDQELTISVIKEIHSLLLDRIHHERGRFKSQENTVVGANFQTVSPSDTFSRMNQWLQNLNDQIQKAKSSDDIILSVCSSHIEFERIHPYSDGNGRTGRLLMMHVLLQNQILPLVILKDNKQEYYQFLENQDATGFAAYAKATIEKEQQRYHAFMNSLPRE
ncbi:Fic family protein [Paenibacillus sp. F411]|uniref:Fic family protein n=1 Tax=Paenibacillus sp. F411 TaxID=2820239 RepID=UPI001AAF83A2|nr:Fic family protein [Paenibacillus sp. F411]MBO2945649.1 Fic family protein [Paenibacillus sp. F411]